MDSLFCLLTFYRLFYPNCKKYFAEFIFEFCEFIFEFIDSKDENSKFNFGNSVSKVGDAEFKVGFLVSKEENCVGNVGVTNTKDEFASTLFEERVAFVVLTLVGFVCIHYIYIGKGIVFKPIYFKLVNNANRY